MKRININQTVLITGILLYLMPIALSGQTVYQKKTASLWDNWSFNLNTGLTSYYGDLSIYDNSISGKFKFESLPAIGVITSKSVNNGISLSGQLLLGRLQGKKSNLQMQSQLVEYNLHIRMNLVELLSGNSNCKFGITGFAGVGNFLFNTKLTELYEGGSKETEFRSRVPEFVNFFGGGISYALNNRTNLTSEFSVRMFQNDKIDGVAQGHKFDYYTYFSIGITHKMRTFQDRASQSKDRSAQSNLSQSPIYRPNLNYNQMLKK